MIVDLTLVLLAALLAGRFAQIAGQPPMVGYIIAGVIVGPHTGGFTVSNVEDIERLAELGVALLLFALGLELSVREMTLVRRVALLGTALQMTLTMALGYLLGRWLGWPWMSSLWFGAALSVSSTLVVLKTLQAQGRIGTLSSRVMIGMLVAQDLAVVPLMIVLPAVTQGADGGPSIVEAIGRAVAFLLAIVIGGTWVVHRVMASVARWGSRELFLLATTAIALGVGYASAMSGLSLALGAFVAGLVVSDSEYGHQALSDVIPLRDVFGMIFFVSVGMLLDPVQVWAQRWTLPLVVAAVVLGKGLVFAAVVRLFGYRLVIPYAAGLTLFQVGEFAFVLTRVGVSTGTLTQEVYGIVLNTALVTMLLTPVVSSLSSLSARFVRRQETFEALNLPATGLSGHVVIAGAGRVGRSIADALAHLGLPFVMIELDDRRVRQARDAGRPIVFGDASQPVVLHAASLEHARALLITAPFFADVRGILRSAHGIRRDLPIVARADGAESVRELYRLGVQEVVSPEFEAGIEMTRQALISLEVPAYEVLRAGSLVRREQYGTDVGPAGTDRGRGAADHLREVAHQLDLRWVPLDAASPMAGRTFAELRVRTTSGAVVVGVWREGRFEANPGAEHRFEAGDLVAVLGHRQQLARFEELAQGRSES